MNLRFQYLVKLNTRILTMNDYIFIDKFSDKEYSRITADNNISAQIQTIKYLLKQDPNNWNCIKDALDIELINISEFPSI